MSDVDPRCAAFEEDLSALLDGELEAARASEVRAHAAACAACTRRLAALRAVDAALGDVASAPLHGEPPRLAALRARLADRSSAAGTGARRAPPRRRTRWLLPAVAGATAAAASALFTLLRPDPAPIASDRGVAIVAQASEPTPAAPPAFAREQLGARDFAGHGASAPDDEQAPAAAPDLAAIDAADLEVVALLDVLDPEPRELRGSQSRDARNRARWHSLRDDAREALRDEWRRFQALAPADRDARLRERSAP